MESNLQTVKGETYKFVNDSVKNSAKVVRKALSNIIKSAKFLRKEVQESLKELPKRRRNIPEDRMKEIVEKRKNTIESKKRRFKKDKPPYQQIPLAPVPQAETKPEPPETQFKIVIDPETK
jgi:hypothetical protein